MKSLRRRGARACGRAMAVLMVQLGFFTLNSLAFAQQPDEARGAAAPRQAPDVPYNPTDEAFPYLETTSTQWFRLTLEELILLLAGSGYYFSEKRVNSADWEFGYNWGTLQRKLVGDGYVFDDNYF